MTVNLFIGAPFGETRHCDRLLSEVQAHCSGNVVVKVLGPEQCQDWRDRDLVRFAIPEIMGMKGRAVYMTQNMSLDGDLIDLLEATTDEYAWQCAFGYKPDVAVVNCDKFDWSWWAEIRWFADCDWNVVTTMKYLARHRKLGMGALAEWHKERVENVC